MTAPARPVPTALHPNAPLAGEGGYEPGASAPIVSERAKLALVVIAASLLSFGGLMVAGYLASRGMLPWQ